MTEPNRREIKVEYGRSMRTQLGHFPVWDLGSQVNIGDYGIVEDNCFTRLGNIVEAFQATPEESVAAQPGFWEFSTEGTQVDDMDLAAALTAMRIEASIKLNFEGAYSIYLRAAESVVKTLANAGEVGRQLANHPGWRRTYVFVASVRTAPMPVVIVSTQRNSSVLLTAHPRILEDVQAGRVEASAKIKVTGNAGLKSIGSPGALYADLMRIRLFGGLGLAALPGKRGVAPIERVDPAKDIEP
jgi:hypothetical protein